MCLMYSGMILVRHASSMLALSSALTEMTGPSCVTCHGDRPGRHIGRLHARRNLVHRLDVLRAMRMSASEPAAASMRRAFSANRSENDTSAASASLTRKVICLIPVGEWPSAAPVAALLDFPACGNPAAPMFRSASSASPALRMIASSPVIASAVPLSICPPAVVPAPPSSAIFRRASSASLAATSVLQLGPLRWPPPSRSRLSIPACRCRSYSSSGLFVSRPARAASVGGGRVDDRLLR